VSVKTASTLALGAAIVASTYWAVERIAEHKADALAGGGTFALDGGQGAEGAAFSALLGQLEGWGEGDLSASLAALRESGHIWIAPRLGGGRSAAYVNALGLVSRIYLGGDELVARSLPFPDLDIPAPAQRTFATMRLAGTLVHELQHFEGVEDEGTAYDREMAWYRQLGERVAGGLEGQEKRYFDWAVASALESVAAARERAEAPGS
jgi:hypothetical protein